MPARAQALACWLYLPYPLIYLIERIVRETEDESPSPALEQITRSSQEFHSRPPTNNSDSGAPQVVSFSLSVADESQQDIRITTPATVEHPHWFVCGAHRAPFEAGCTGCITMYVSITFLWVC